MTDTDTPMTLNAIARGMNMAADRYSKWADDAEVTAAKKTEASYFYGKASAYRQAAIDFRMLADLAVAK